MIMQHLLIVLYFPESRSISHPVVEKASTEQGITWPHDQTMQSQSELTQAWVVALLLERLSTAGASVWRNPPVLAKPAGRHRDAVTGVGQDRDHGMIRKEIIVACYIMLQNQVQE